MVSRRLLRTYHMGVFLSLNGVSTDRKFTSLVLCKLFTIALFFHNTSRLGFTFDCKTNQIVLKKAEQHLKPHTAVYAQNGLLDWTERVWQMVTEDSLKPGLGKEAGWLFLYDSFLAHSLKTRVSCWCTEAALPSETGVRCSRCTDGLCTQRGVEIS